MGDRLTEDEKQKQTSLTPYGDIFDEALPHYMSIGMTYDEFWDGEYGTKRAARKAYKLRMENEQRLADRNNWYMGQYMIAVLQSVPLLVNGLLKKGVTLPKYPNKPFFDQYEEKKKEENRKQREEDQMKLAMAMFQAGIARFNKRFESQEQPKQERTGQ